MTDPPNPGTREERPFRLSSAAELDGTCLDVRPLVAGVVGTGRLAGLFVALNTFKGCLHRRPALGRRHRKAVFGTFPGRSDGTRAADGRSWPMSRETGLPSARTSPSWLPEDMWVWTQIEVVLASTEGIPGRNSVSPIRCQRRELQCAPELRRWRNNFTCRSGLDPARIKIMWVSVDARGAAGLPGRNQSTHSP